MAAVYPTPQQVATGVVYGPSGNDYTGILQSTTPQVTVPVPAPVSLGDSETTIYLCPASNIATVRVVHLCNTDDEARTVTVYKVKVGDTAADDTTELKVYSLGAAGTTSSTYNMGPITLVAGDKISGKGDVASTVTAIAEVFLVAQ